MKKDIAKAPSNLGLYIHIPFCRRKCLYCDFCSFPAQKGEAIERYIDALCREIRSASAEARDKTVDTVYFGGGTPSILSVGQIERLLCEIRENFTVLRDAEITLECNPMTRGEGNGEYFSRLRALGVNRLSIGVQSANENELKLIGRGHTFAEAKETYRAAREGGFENISVDLMFGIPSQTVKTLDSSLNALIELAPEHISIYSLQLEEGTPLYKMQERYELADGDTVADMYELIVEKMRRAGYSHYEISNFAREGRASRHNLKYWKLDEYLGLGLSAHSDINGARRENTAVLDEYLADRWRKSERAIGSSEREEEYIMLGLRTSDGISCAEFKERFDKDLLSVYGKKLASLEKTGFLLMNGENIRLTERGFEVSNAILCELLELDY